MTDDEPLPTEAPAADILDREALLKVLTRAINETDDRITGERFRPREGDRDRLAYLRTLIGLISTYNAVLIGAKDHDMARLPPTPPRPLTEREKRRNEKMTADMEDLLDSLAGIKPL
jgi:hypothetical protein